MKNEKQQQLDELYKQLIIFWKDCNIAPKCHEDLKNYWIIDKQELMTIQALVNLLKDCGAENQADF